MLGARPEPLNLSLPLQLALAVAHIHPSRASGFELGRIPVIDSNGPQATHSRRSTERRRAIIPTGTRPSMVRHAQPPATPPIHSSWRSDALEVDAPSKRVRQPPTPAASDKSSLNSKHNMSEQGGWAR